MKPFLIFSFSLFISFSMAQDPVQEKHWWTPNGQVSVIVHDTLSNHLYLGGEFTSVSAPVTGNAFLDRLTGYPDMRFPEIIGSINASVKDGSGGWFIGGTFTMVGDSVRSRIAHITSTGEISSKFAGVGFNGQVYDMALSNDSLFVSGGFTGFGGSMNNVGIADKMNGEVNLNFPEFDGSYIFEIISDNNGGWFVSGNFDSVGDSIRNGIVHINNNYQVTGWNPQIEGSVNSMELSSGILYVGGSITSINGQARTYLGAIDAISGLPTSFAPNINSAVHKIAINNNSIYLAGAFSTVNGASNAYFACLDKTTGATIPDNLFIMSSIYSFGDMLVHNDTLYIGGYFSTGFQNNLVAVNTINNTQLNWYPQIDSTIHALEWYNGNLIAGGQMSQGVCKVNPVTGNVTSVLNAQGTAWSLHVVGDTLYIGGNNYAPDHCVSATNLVTNQPVTWDPMFTGNASAICSNNTHIIVGGPYLQAYSGTKRNMLAAFDASNGNLTSWNPPGVDNTYYGIGPLFAFEDKIYVGGEFSMFGDSLRSCIVELDRYQGNVTSWNGPLINSFSRFVEDLYVNDNNIFAGGNFGYTHNGVNKQDLVIINRNSGNIEPWNISANSYGVYKILPVGDLLYIAGNYDTIAGQHIPNVAAIETATGALHSVNIHPNKAVYDISNFGDKLYMVGNYDSINGISRKGLCAYDMITDDIDSWYPAPDDNTPYMLHVNTDADKVIVSGSFTSLGAVNRKNFVALDCLTGRPLSLSPDPDKKVTGIAYSVNSIYLAGLFDTIANTLRNSLACIDKITGILDPWDPGIPFNYGADDILVDGSKLYVGGSFGTINGQSRRNLAALDIPAHTLDPLSVFISQHVYDIEKRNDTLFMAGYIDTIMTSFNAGIISLNVNTGQWINLNSSGSFSEPTYSIALTNDKVIVGGEFDEIGTIPRNLIAAFDINPPGISSWDPFAANWIINNIIIRSLVIYDSVVFVGGTYTFPGNAVNESRRYFAEINTTTGLCSPWNPEFGDINGMHVSKHRLFIGGNISYDGRTKFLAFKLKPGPEMTQLADVTICTGDTIGPFSFTITDPVDVNTVSLAGYSSDTSIVSTNNIIFSGTGANRNIIVVFNPGASGTVTITVVATNQEGVSSQMYFNIHQVNPQVQITGNASFCAGNTTSIDAGPGYSNYLWNTGEITQTLTITQSGIYSVTVTDAYGCVGSDSITVTQNPLPVAVATATPGLEICLGDSTMLSVTPGYPGYQWLKNNNVLAGETNSIYYAKFTANFRCVVTDVNSCTNTTNNLRVRVVCIPPHDDEERNVSVGDDETEFLVTIQPNPSSDDFVVTTNCHYQGRIEVDVFDNSGRQVQSDPGILLNENGNFVISKMPPGFYFARVRCGNEEKIIKIVQGN